MTSFAKIKKNEGKIEFREQQEIELHTLANCMTPPLTIKIFETVYKESEKISELLISTKWKDTKSVLKLAEMERK